MPEHLGKLLVTVGLVIVLLGLIFMVGGKTSWLGKLPGDITIQKKNVNFYFPLASCIIISLIISVIMWLLNRR